MHGFLCYECSSNRIWLVGGGYSYGRHCGGRLRTSPYCRTCWLDWHVKEELLNGVAAALTVHVTHVDDALLALSVCNMAGVEVLLESGVDADATTISDLRSLLLKKLKFEERRLAPDGCFYTKAAFDEWYAPGGCAGASQMWEGAAKGPEQRLELLLPNGARIAPSADHLSIRAALDAVSCAS